MNRWEKQFQAFLRPREPDRYALYRTFLHSLTRPENFWNGLEEESANLASTKLSQLHYLFFAAVQHQALADPNETLSRYFPASPSYTPSEIDKKTPHFEEFVNRHWSAIWQLIRDHEVQINKLGRLSLFAPFFLEICRHESAPAFIEAGSSLGLGLLWPELSFDYLGHGKISGPRAVSNLTCAIRGTPTFPIQGRLSYPSFIRGIDLRPLDYRNLDHIRWLKSLTAPGDAEGRLALELGLNLAHRSSFRIERGCIIEVLPRLIGEIPPHKTLVIYHAMTMHHLREAGKESTFLELLASLSRERRIYQISVEWECVETTNQPPNVVVTCRVWKSEIPSILSRARTDPSADGRWLDFSNPMDYIQEN